MLIKNVRIENAEASQDIRIADGLFKEIGPNLTGQAGEEVIDGQGKLALPPFIESHIHLDSCLTAGQPKWNESGTLFEGIETWALRKQSLDKADIKDRVNRLVRMQAANGIQFVRTHVDVTDPKLVALEALLELKEDLAGLVDIQITAFPQEGIHSFPNGKELLEQAVKLGADVVGAIPHYEFTREYSVESLRFAMDLAEKYDKLVDVHCDEIDDGQSRGLETLACLAYESGLKDRVTASHTTAMGSYNNAYVVKLMRLLKLADINFIANPLVNIHLQGRLDTYPKRRGLTRVKELLANGNNVAFGHDDVFDPWYPLGDGNPLEVIHMGLHVGQLMGYQEIMDSYKFSTHAAAKCLYIQDDYGIEVGKPANLIIMNNDNFYKALNERSEVLYSIRNGRVIAKTQPKVKDVLF
ncbi:cytosine deaminase [Aerococcus urinaehominis]|uniref:Cytosine deaminase n=1 Tax=Aerococcus urinaehominis TaxID=128944 RepID=A0A0X8FJT4_9LACT|nr:cytosine deaminase [Aerococcus urinaehominis]AMB98595.1 cytosine deaminase [Aerococcus urinaehominis]SDL76409.1 cytosine deaminase [Aerococcus urinaehominis]